MASDLIITSADPERLRVLRATGRDHGDNAVVPFIDEEDGGWPLRCCLQQSDRGERLAIVAWCPFPWRGPYAEVGPIVIHADECDGITGSGVPPQFLGRRQIARPYGHDKRIAYDDAVLVEADGTLPIVLEDLLGRNWIDFVVVRNVLSGCYSFMARLG